MNKTIKLLSSIPIILLLLYYIPILGVLLIIVRNFVYNDRKRKYLPTICILLGIILLIPSLIDKILNAMNLSKNSIPYFNTIITSDIYNINALNFSKTLIIVGILFFIIDFIFSKIIDSIRSFIKGYISNQEKINTKISEKNDLIMKEKQLKAKNNHVVRCPNCGSDNMLTEQTGICKYCRNPIEYKKSNE